MVAQKELRPVSRNLSKATNCWRGGLRASRPAVGIEAYPDKQPKKNDAGHFRSPRAMYDARGFAPINERERDTVVRRPVLEVVR